MKFLIVWSFQNRNLSDSKMLSFKLPRIKELENMESKLKKLDAITEEDLFRIYARPEDQWGFKDGKANDFPYDFDMSLGLKMILRLRKAADICYFWNGVDPHNRELLLRSVGLNGKMVGMDFFIWLGNTHVKWTEGNIGQSCIEGYFSSNEDQKKSYIEEYCKVMDGFQCF